MPSRLTIPSAMAYGARGAGGVARLGHAVASVDLGVDLGPGECGLDPGVEQLVGVGQAKGQQRSKAVKQARLKGPPARLKGNRAHYW